MDEAAAFPRMNIRALVLAFIIGLLVSCAQAPQSPDKTSGKLLAYPPPPEEPRLVYERSIYTSADVVADEAVSEFRRMVTGEARSGEGLAKPYAVAVRQGRIYVSDSVERFIKAFDIPTGKYFRIGVEEPGQLTKPLGIDVDEAGNLYVADATVKAVVVYDKDGKFLRKIGGRKNFERLTSVAVEPKGDRVYVVDIGGVNSEEHRVRVFDAVNGNHLFDIGKRGKENGEFNLPRDVAVTKDAIYVVDGGNFRVQAFDRQGKFLRSFGSVGRQYGQFARPKEIAADHDGNLYIVDTAFGNFQIFDGQGQLLLFVGERSERDGPGKYMLPSGISVDEDGRVYMVDQWFKKIDIYRPAHMKATDGKLVRKSGPGTPAK